MSKKIDISNYEVHALDYLEGTLPGELKAEFEAFLLLHPEIAEELEEMRGMESLVATPDVVFDKEALKMEIHATENIDEGNYEALLIAEVEGNLSAAEKEEMDAFMAKNEPLQRDRALYQKSRLKADEAVVYPDRKALYKAIPLWATAQTYAYRVAAVLVVALGSVTVFNMLDQEVYMPRNNAPDFSNLETFAPQRSVERSQRQAPEVEGPYQESTGAIASNDPAPTAVKRVNAPSKIETLNPEIGIQTESNFDDRELLAYQPSISEWIGDPVDAPSGGQTLNLAQFVGKKLFGLEPKQSETPKDLIRGGLIKTIDDQDAFAFKTSNPEDDKRSVEFLAGNFEFRRVSHK